jgi:hypothetical protein
MVPFMILLQPTNRHLRISKLTNPQAEISQKTVPLPDNREKRASHRCRHGRAPGYPVIRSRSDVNARHRQGMTSAEHSMARLVTAIRNRRPARRQTRMLTDIRASIGQLARRNYDFTRGQEQEQPPARVLARAGPSGRPIDISMRRSAPLSSKSLTMRCGSLVTCLRYCPSSMSLVRAAWNCLDMAFSVLSRFLPSGVVCPSRDRNPTPRPVPAVAVNAPHLKLFQRLEDMFMERTQ